VCLVLVSQDRSAETQHNRPVALDERGEGSLGCVAGAGRGPFEQLAVRHDSGHMGSR
jgi:hypothetical protein